MAMGKARLLDKALLIVEGNERRRRALAGFAVEEAKAKMPARVIVLATGQVPVELRLVRSEQSEEIDLGRGLEEAACGHAGAKAGDVWVSMGIAKRQRKRRRMDARLVERLEMAGALALRAAMSSREGEGVLVVIDDTASILLSCPDAMAWAARLLKGLDLSDARTIVLAEGLAGAAGGLAVDRRLLASVCGFWEEWLAYGRRVAVGSCSCAAVEQYSEAMVERFSRTGAKFARLLEAVGDDEFVLVEDSFGHRHCSLLDASRLG